MACLSAVVAVSLAGFTAMHSNMPNLATPKGDKSNSVHLIFNFRKNYQKQDYKPALTCNISPYRKVSGCDQTRRRSSTSARWHDHSHGPCGQLCHRCSRAAPSPFWALCSPGKCGHSCDSCSTLNGNKNSFAKCKKLLRFQDWHICLLRNIKYYSYYTVRMTSVPGIKM